jgi:hypothetical protein
MFHAKIAKDAKARPGLVFPDRPKGIHSSRRILEYLLFFLSRLWRD